MASVSKKPSDRARGKAGKYTCYYLGADGKKKSKVGTTDKQQSQQMANALEARERLIREGLLDPGDEIRRIASLKSVVDHAADYGLELLAKGDKKKHADHVTGVLRRLLADAEIRSVADLAPDRIRAALGRLKVRRSARTCNHAIGAIKAFATWLHHSNRIDQIPRGIQALKPYNEKEDRRRVRRALTIEEVERLLSVTEAAPPVKLSRRGYQYTERFLTGPERAALYRLAMGTGFRAEELRTLTPERFELEGDEPSITVLASIAKNGKEAVQPITRDLAAKFRPFLEGKPPGQPVLHVPEKTAQLLRGDLALAEIPYKDSQGRVVDFHALRTSYITHLILRGENPKVVQVLARHSTITLTLDTYTQIERSDLRKAIEGE